MVSSLSPPLTCFTKLHMDGRRAEENARAGNKTQRVQCRACELGLSIKQSFRWLHISSVRGAVGWEGRAMTLYVPRLVVRCSSFRGILLEIRPDVF